MAIKSLIRHFFRHFFRQKFLIDIQQIRVIIMVEYEIIVCKQALLFAFISNSNVFLYSTQYSVIKFLGKKVSTFVNTPTYYVSFFY